MESDSVFSLPQQLENVWHGIDKYDLSQIIPEGGVPNNVVVGSGSASGNMIFQWTENASWWSPVNSYFYFKLRFAKHTGASPGPIPTWNDATAAPNPAEFVTYCDNFISTLFTTIQTNINNEPIDTITQPWIIDQIMTYSNAKKNFLDTFGSLARVGEPLMKRLSNVYDNGAAGGAVVEVCYRPPCSLYSVNLLPPGAQHRIEFTWAGSAINAFESLIGSIPVGTTDGTYNIYVDDVKFYKATCSPSPLLPVPQHGVIELSRCSIKQYFSNGASSYQQSITLDDTTNRIYLTFQDNYQSAPVALITSTDSPLIDNEAKFMGIGTGWNPTTSFSKAFTSNPTGTTLAEIANLYVNIDDLALVLPKPVYNFSQNLSDWNRAYMDWATMSVGTKYNDTGSVPFGFAIGSANTPATTFASMKIPGAQLAILDTTAIGDSTFQSGQPENPQEAKLNYQALKASVFGAGAGLIQATSSRSLFFQTCEYGWLGKHPGPIFAFNICRPVGVKLSRGTVNVTFNGSPNNVIISVVCCSSAALAVQKINDRQYSYQRVSGV